MDALVQDLSYAFRTLRKTPGFTTVAVLTLALGIGMNTTIFSVIEGVLLRPLPYDSPERIMVLSEVTETGGEVHVSGPNFRDWKAQTRSFEALALHSSADFGGPTTVLGGREATRAQVTVVSADFLPVFRVQPVIGRAFAIDDFAWGANVVIVSYGFWRDQLGGERNLATLKVDLYGRPRQVIGVMPPGFRYPAETDIWGPTPPADEGRRAHNWRVVGRARPGVTLVAARIEMTQLARRLKREYAGGTDAVDVRVTPLQENLVGHLRRPLTLLLGASAFVLLVACTNLASTLLARGAARQREFAVRESLGASPGRLVLQLLTESVLLAALGAVASLLLSKWLIAGLVASAPGLPRLDEVRLDGRVLAFTAGVAMFAAVLFGLLPAFRTALGQRSEALLGGGRGAAPHRSGPWNLLVTSEVTLAFVLLIGAGLLIRSFWEVLSQNPGFTDAQVLAVELAPPESKYSDEEDRGAARGRYFQQVLHGLSTLPGGVTVGLVNHLPLSGFSWNGDFEIEGRGSNRGVADYRIADGDYFKALGIHVLRGRVFEERDEGAGGDVAVIDRALAERYWPGEDPVGKRIRNLANDSWIYPDRWLTIIGEVESVRHDALTSQPRAAVYVYYRQRPGRLASATIVLRGSTPPTLLVGPVRARLRAIDPDVPAEFTTLEHVIRTSVTSRRFTVLVLGSFAGLALVLAALGIYGVISYAVQRRTREMGIRLALGAAPRGVVAMVLRESLTVVAVGSLLGLGGAAALTQVIRGMLYGVQPLDPLVLVMVALLLALIATLATYIPARRAGRVDPVVALRNE
jgi:predicted permease